MHRRFFVANKAACDCCQVCEADAPTRQVEFSQNVGFLLFRQEKTIRGELCRSCIDKYFTEYTLITLLIGWYGVVSCFAAPYFVIKNVACYLRCLGLPRCHLDPYRR